MSETVHYKGVLKKVERLENESLEEQCKRLLNNIVLEEYCDSYQEMLLDDYYQKYIIHEGVIYSVDKQDVNPDWDIFNANINEDGNINFEVRYYNGGCGFNEAIENALNNIKE